MEWISIKDQLPDKGLVLIYGEDYYTYQKTIKVSSLFKNYCNTGENVWMDADRIDVSHWMPMPEPPADWE